MQLANEPLDGLPPLPPPFAPSALIRSVNIFWFTSLTLSLFAALFGIFVKQWLHNYSNWSDIPHAATAVRVRNSYYNSLKTWHTPNIVAALPLLLQLALLFFAIGLVVYLWTLDAVVAGAVTLLMVAGVIAAIVAIILPVWFNRCPYKTPIGLSLVRLLRRSIHTSWTQREINLQDHLPNGFRDRQMDAYRDVCAVLELVPTQNGPNKQQLIVSQVKELNLDSSDFDLLMSLIEEFSSSSHSAVVDVLWCSMFNTLKAIDNSRHIRNPSLRSIALRLAHLVTCLTPVTSPPQLVDVIDICLRMFKMFTKHAPFLPELYPDATPDDPIPNHSAMIHAANKMAFYIRDQILTATLHQSVVQATIDIWVDQWEALNTILQSLWPAQVHQVLPDNPTGNPQIYAIGLSQDSRYLVSATANAFVWFWEIENSFSQPISNDLLAPGARSMILSPDGIHLIVGAGGGTQLMKLKFKLGGSGHDIWTDFRTTGDSVDISVAISHDGSHVVSCTAQGTVQMLVDNVVSHAVSISRDFAGPLECLCWSPTQKTCIALARQSIVEMLDSSTLDVTRTLRGHTGPVKSCAFSPNGMQLATGSSDSTVRVWDVETAAEQLICRGHTEEVRAVAYSPDGHHIVTGSVDQTVRLWDTDTGASLKVLGHHTAAVASVAVSPNGLLIASGTEDGWTSVWPMPPNDFPERLRRKASKGAIGAASSQQVRA